MFSVAGNLNVPYIHYAHEEEIRSTMQSNIAYDDVVADILKWFGERIFLITICRIKGYTY